MARQILICLAAFAVPTCAFAQSSSGVVGEQRQPVEKGFLFVDGNYISPPYDFRSDENGVSVNGVSMEYTSLGLGEDDFFKWEVVPREKTGSEDEKEVTFRRRPIRPRLPWRNVSPHLHDDNNVVVIFSNERPAILTNGVSGYDTILRLLCRHDGNSVSDAELKRFGDIDRARWNEWITGFQPSPEFKARARAQIEEADSIVEENYRAARANQRLNTATYPLTVIGMLLVVVAAGHLISYRPMPCAERKSTTLPVEEHRAVACCLLLVAGLSALDLAWTVLAHQAGAITELNPVGARIIDNPHVLIAFKGILTLVSAGILYAARRHIFARRACWWCCLVCTLLIARWISVTSAFV
jgi:Domain of unknown function (DUF5658)